MKGQFYIEGQSTLNSANKASSAIRIRIGQNNRKFISPMPRCDIDSAALSPKRFAQTAQRAAAREMAERFID